MSQIKVRGIIPKLKADYNEFRLKVDNGPELEEFFKRERVNTKLDYSDGKPFIKVRGRLALLCHEGDRVCLTIETYERIDGNRIRGVDIQVL